jgi:hypothetical protein
MMRWAEHVANMIKSRTAKRSIVGPKGRYHLEGPGMNGR